MAGIATSFILIMALNCCLGSDLYGQYEIPMEYVEESPFESFSEYPMMENGMKVNDAGTHVFWPKEQQLYSKNYMHLRFDNQKILSVSQQFFAEQRKNVLFPKWYTSMAGNDHLAFTKTEGDWPIQPVRDYDIQDDLHSDTELDLSPLEYATLSAKSQLRLFETLMWMGAMQLPNIFQNQTVLRAQFPLLKKLEFTDETQATQDRLEREMEEFSDGVSLENFHKADKSAFMCYHMTTDDPVMEGDVEGWWTPLKTPILSWRAFALQSPNEKFLIFIGPSYITVDGDKLKVVYDGRQAFRSDIDGIDFSNVKLYIAPPHVPDDRPAPPMKPSWFMRHTLGAALLNSAPHKKLGWVKRDILCSKEFFDKTFNEYTTSCERKLESVACYTNFIKFYPCFNYYLRASQKFSHGIDGLAEVIAVKHFSGELPWSTVRELVEQKPWDDEMDQAIKLLDLDHIETKSWTGTKKILSKMPFWSKN